MIEKLKWDGKSWIDEEGVSHETKQDYLQTNILGFCGCGDPTSVMIYVRDLLRKLDLQDWGKSEDLSYMFFVHWANDKSFADHGTIARCSWLTPLGKELLRDIDECLQGQAADGAQPKKIV